MSELVAIINFIVGVLYIVIAFVVVPGIGFDRWVLPILMAFFIGSGIHHFYTFEDVLVHPEHYVDVLVNYLLIDGVLAITGIITITYMIIRRIRLVAKNPNQ